MSNFKALVKTATKRSIYEKYGIEYRNGKIYHSEFGWINPLLMRRTKSLFAAFTQAAILISILAATNT